MLKHMFTANFDARLDGKLHKNVATKAGDAYTALTGDPRGSAIGRTIDNATPDVEIDLDEGKVRWKQ
jgi:hypothetical protein